MRCGYFNLNQVTKLPEYDEPNPTHLAPPNSCFFSIEMLFINVPRSANTCSMDRYTKFEVFKLLKHIIIKKKSIKIDVFLLVRKYVS